MKTRHILPFAALLGTLVTAAPFDSGSTGALGDLLVTNATVIPLPPDGVLHYKRVEITREGSVTFVKNALNTPVTLVAQGEVIIAGDLLLDGTGPTGGDPGRAGPGGFDGGRGNSGDQPAGPGRGPGGAKPGFEFGAGSGAYADQGETGGGRGAVAGDTYGDPLLLPVIGGSGGGGRTECYCGGGGGGGAILIASSIRIALPTAEHGVFARGGSALQNGGSGGAIRLVAPVVEGVGTLNVIGGAHSGSGRIRIDSPDASKATFALAGHWSIGSLMLTKLPIEPKLNLLKIGDKDIPQDAAGTVIVVLPSGTPAERIVQVQAKDFGSVVPIRVTLTPDYGNRVIVDAELDNTAAGVATVNVPVTFPLNVTVAVNVWTR